jgi:hypothetical protein
MELFLLDEDIKLAEGYAAMAAAETESAPLRRQRRERRQQIGNTTPQKARASRQATTGSIKRTPTVSYKLSAFHQANDDPDDGTMQYARHYAEQRAQQGTSPQAEIPQENLRILRPPELFLTSFGPLELPPGLR